jgi:exosortase A
MKQDTKLRISILESQMILLSLLLVSFIFAFFPVWKSLFNAWYKSDDYSHGFLIVPIALYIIWRKREVLTLTPVKPVWWGLAVLVFSLLLYMTGHFGEIVTLKSLSLIGALAGVVLYLLGFRFIRELQFPLFLLFFMIPVPAQIYSTGTIPLQLLVSKVSSAIAFLIGIPIYHEGNLIYLPERTLEVVQACSGLRSMVSLLTLSALIGYFTLKSNVLRSLIFLLSVPTAILVNIIRVLLIIITFHYFNHDLTEGVAHTLLGVIIFVLAMVSLFGAKGVLSNWDKSATEESSQS